MIFGKRNPRNLRAKKSKQKLTVHLHIGDGWHKQGPKVQFKSLRIYPDSVPYINAILKAGLPINLNVMPNPTHKENPREPPLKVFLAYTKLVEE